jgi:hypothetical protein
MELVPVTIHANMFRTHSFSEVKIPTQLANRNINNTVRFAVEEFARFNSKIGDYINPG